MGESSLWGRALSVTMVSAWLPYSKGLSSGGISNGLQSLANLLI